MDNNDDDTKLLTLVGLDGGTDPDDLESHIARSVGEVVLSVDLEGGATKQSISANVRLRSSKSVERLAKLLQKTELGGRPLNVVIPRGSNEEKEKRPVKITMSAARELAGKFHDYIVSNETLYERCSDREELGIVFQAFLDGISTVQRKLSGKRRVEGMVMSQLRRMKLLKTKRYDDIVVTTIARDGPGQFPPKEKHKTEKKKLLEKKASEEMDKEGVEVSRPELGGVIVPPKGSLEIKFTISTSLSLVTMHEIKLGRTGGKIFQLSNPDCPRTLQGQDCFSVTFRSPGVGLFREKVRFIFMSDALVFTIARYMKVKSGDPIAADLLKPVAPYQKKKIKYTERKPDKIIPAPPRKMQGKNPFEKLPQYRIPAEVRDLTIANELEHSITHYMEDIEQYGSFWKHLLWASEFQASQDIKLFDLEGVKLYHDGPNHMVLTVPGLAEGRPSVLRGDQVKVTWKNECYYGSVFLTRLNDVLLQFNKSFHKNFNTSLDRVDVRFTFSRMTFRTCHEGCAHARTSMGMSMILPSLKDAVDSLGKGRFRRIPSAISWANRHLNEEQKHAVAAILKGSCRPLPYIIFGPPGTGKTTTVVEAVYQLARHTSGLKTLLVAPSNDAADILVEKLASYFPPTEMCRILAYSRSVEQAPPAIRRYCVETKSGGELKEVITGMKIVVSTVNNASRLAWRDVPQGHFDVLCVDEAGHCTEPELIGVAATLFDFQRGDDKAPQMILGGDPKQLGPVVTSAVCRKLGLSVSYMERLSLRGIYEKNEMGEYHPDLVMKLVRNYRSHPSILRLPNEMFYENDLITSGDPVTTYSLCRWEHLPKQQFPIVFHSIHGENLRESNSPSWFNPEEAQQAVAYVEKLVRDTRPAVSPEDIGIITPYARQAQKIRLLLKQKNFCDVKVGSVETFQGQERRCIILSTVRAEVDLIASDLKYNLGFVANSKRFNVAITRAKSLLIVIGDPKLLAMDKKNWLPFLSYCKESGGWIGESWDEDEEEGELNGRDIYVEVEEEEEWDTIDTTEAHEGAYINREE